MSSVVDLPSEFTSEKPEVIFQLPSLPLPSFSLSDTPLQSNKESSQLKYEYIFTKKHEYCYIDRQYREYLQLNEAEENVTLRKKDDKVSLHKNYYEKINYDKIPSLPPLPQQTPLAITSSSLHLPLPQKFKQKQVLTYIICIFVVIAITLLIFIAFLGGI